MGVVFLTSASSSPWSKPGHFVNAGHTVELVGCGGKGGAGTTGTSGRGATGAGGGAYCKLTANGTLGSTTPFVVNSQNTVVADNVTNQTQWENTTAGVDCYFAQCGAAISTGGATIGASGGITANSVGTPPVTYTKTTVDVAGGNGGGITSNTNITGGGGGGGAAGPTGAGKNGGTAPNTSGGGASGGGGANGGSSTAGSNGVTTTGGNGGAGNGGSGGGSGGTTTGGNGSTGGGGEGSDGSAVGGTNLTGGNGGTLGNATNWTQSSDGATAGAGGGGGGAGANSVNNSSTLTGGNGANYGGGGGSTGGHRNTGSTRNGGTGGGGLIVIVFSNAITSTVSSAQSVTATKRMAKTQTVTSAELMTCSAARPPTAKNLTISSPHAMSSRTLIGKTLELISSNLATSMVLDNPYEESPQGNPVGQYVAVSDSGRYGYVNVSAQLYYTHDYGATWTKSGQTPGALACSGDGQTVLMTVFTGSSVISTDFGVNWTALGGGLPSNISASRVCMSKNGQRMCIPKTNATAAIWTSSDGGANWSSSSHPANTINTVTCDDSGLIVIGSVTSGTRGWYQSFDGGVTWGTQFTSSSAGTAVISGDGKTIFANRGNTGDALRTKDGLIENLTSFGSTYFTQGAGQFAIARNGRSALVIRLTPSNFGHISMTSDGGDTWVDLLDDTTVQSISAAMGLNKDGTNVLIAIINTSGSATYHYTGRGKSVKPAVLKDRNVFINSTSSELVTLRRTVGKLSSIVSAQALTLVRRAAHLISVSSPQLVTATFPGGGSRTISVMQTQLVTLRDQISKLVSLAIASAASITVVPAFGRTLLVSSPHAITGTVQADLTLTTPTGAGFSQAVTLTKVAAQAKLISVVQSSVVTLTRASANVKEFAISIGEVITLLRRDARTILVPIPSDVSGALVATKTATLTSSSPAQVVTLTKVYAQVKLISVLQASLVTATRLPGKVLSVSIGEIVTLLRRAAHVISVFTSHLISGTVHARIALSDLQSAGTAHSVTLTKISAQSKLILVLQASTVTLTRKAAHVISVSIAQSVSLLKGAAKTIVITSSELVTMSKGATEKLILVFTSHSITGTVRATINTSQTGQGTGQTVTLTRQLANLRTLTVAIGQTVTMTRIAAHRLIIVATSSQLVLLVQAAAHRLTVNVLSSQLVTLTRRAGHLISVSLSELVTLAKQQQAGTINKAINFTQTQAVTLTRGVRHIIATITQAQLVTLTRRAARTISVSIASLVTLARVKSARRTITMTSGEQLTLLRSRTLNQLVVVSANSLVTLARTTRHEIVATLLSAQNVSLVRAAARTIVLQIPEEVVIERGIARTISLSTAEHVTLSAAAGNEVTITISSPSLVTLQTAIHVVTEFFVNVAVSIGQLVSLLTQIVRGRPRSTHLRASELSQNLDAKAPTTNLTATRPNPEI